MGDDHVCMSCKFFQPRGNDDGTFGTCRRYAPSAITGDPDGKTYAIFPSVGRYDWCGEWTLPIEVPTP